MDKIMVLKNFTTALPQSRMPIPISCGSLELSESPDVYQEL